MCLILTEGDIKISKQSIEDFCLLVDVVELIHYPSHLTLSYHTFSLGPIPKLVQLGHALAMGGNHLLVDPLQVLPLSDGAPGQSPHHLHHLIQLLTLSIQQFNHLIDANIKILQYQEVLLQTSKL